MKANLDTRRVVNPVRGGLNAPDVYGGQRRVYEAERSGLAQLGRAYENAGKAVAHCGELLTRYDQEMLNRDFAADSRMLQVKYAQEYAALDEKMRKRTFANSEEFKSAYAAESEAINSRMSREIRNGSGSDGFVFRNAERWETELTQMAEIQQATGMLRATQNWLTEQERITNAVNDAKLNSLVQTGTSAEAKGFIEELKKENPRYAELYDAKLRPALSAIAVRDANSAIDLCAETVAREAQGYIEEAEEARQNALAEADAPTEGGTKSRSAVLEARKRRDGGVEKAEADAKAEFFTKIAARQKEYFDKVIEPSIDGNADIADKDKSRLKAKAKRDMAAAAQAQWAAYSRQKTAEKQERSDAFKKRLVEAMPNPSQLNSDPAFATFAPSAELLNPDNPEEAAFMFVDDAAFAKQSRANTLAALVQLGQLDGKGADFAEKAIRIAEELRLRGVSREDYGKFWSSLSGKATGTSKASAELEKAWQARTVKKLNEAYGAEWKDLAEAIADERTNDEVDMMIAGLNQIKTTTGDYATICNFTDGLFAESLRAKDKTKAAERGAAMMNRILGGGKLAAYDANPAGVSAGIAAERAETRRKYMDEVEKEERNREEMRRLLEDAPKNFTEAIYKGQMSAMPGGTY